MALHRFVIFLTCRTFTLWLVSIISSVLECWRTVCHDCMLIPDRHVTSGFLCSCVPKILHKLRANPPTSFCTQHAQLRLWSPKWIVGCFLINDSRTLLMSILSLFIVSSEQIISHVLTVSLVIPPLPLPPLSRDLILQRLTCPSLPPCMFNIIERNRQPRKVNNLFLIQMKIQFFLIKRQSISIDFTK